MPVDSSLELDEFWFGLGSTIQDWCFGTVGVLFKY